MLHCVTLRRPTQVIDLSARRGKRGDLTAGVSFVYVEMDAARDNGEPMCGFHIRPSQAPVFIDALTALIEELRSYQERRG